jgi:hypothetical protein
MLAAIEAGDLEATTSMRYRLQGGGAALDAVLGHDPSLLDSLDD